MRFRDRSDAGRQLASRLLPLRGKDVVVLGLPRGGVAVAAEVARALDAPLDVILVRKLGVPAQPELGMGAIGEGDARVINTDVVRYSGASEADISAVERRERAELERRTKRFRGDAPREPLAGRIAVLVDDGIATGSTARAACQVARAQGAARVVLAAPVAPPSARSTLAGDADELVCLETPERFLAIGEWYDDFSQTRDEEVVALLRAARAEHTNNGQEERVTENADAADGTGHGVTVTDASGAGATVEGAVAEGSAVEGSAVEGSAVEGSVAEGSVAEGSADAGGAAEDSVSTGATVADANSAGAAAESSVSEGSASAGAAAAGAAGASAAGDSLASLVAMMPFAAGLGMVLDAAKPDEVRARMAWAPELCTTGGLLHGGALMAFADSLGGICAYLNLPAGARTATTSSATVFTRAVRDGEVTAIARPLHVGRTVIVVQTDLHDQSGRRVAQVTQTQAVLGGGG
jgi:putative phosphoribosyl transferase